MKKHFFIGLFLSIFCIGNAQNIPNPKVVNIYPTTDSIPVNILRFYIQFSAPMQEMEILKHIKLSDENGKNISGVFYENQYELWNNDRTEVTLIVDPGRVKLGLFANNTMGRAFDKGKKYTLQVDSLLLDFNNQKLANSFTKTFIAVKEDRIAPNIKNWKLELPKVNTKEALTIDFMDYIDHISANSYIKIYKDNSEVKGEISLKRNEQVWFFEPQKKWKKGNYQIVVNPKLEDIAANSLNQIFDHKPENLLQSNDENGIIKFNIIK